MKKIFFLQSLYTFAFLCFSTVALAQNDKIIASTSIGFIRNNSSIIGINQNGFSTLTGVEYNLYHNLWLVANLDFQSIGYKRQLENLSIKSRINAIPILVGGKFNFENKSKFIPYIGATIGFSYFSIPDGSNENGKVEIFSETFIPFTYAFNLGVQWNFKSKLLPFVELTYQKTTKELNALSEKPNFIPIRIGFRTYPF